MAQTPPASDTKRRLRRIAHHLDAVMVVGQHGLSAALIAETQRALADHELIKVRIHVTDRDERLATARTLAQACEAAVIQNIGKISVLYRKNPEPNPKLSNLARFGS